MLAHGAKPNPGFQLQPLDNCSAPVETAGAQFRRTVLLVAGATVVLVAMATRAALVTTPVPVKFPTRDRSNRPVASAPHLSEAFKSALPIASGFAENEWGRTVPRDIGTTRALHTALRREQARPTSRNGLAPRIVGGVELTSAAPFAVTPRLTEHVSQAPGVTVGKLVRVGGMTTAPFAQPLAAPTAWRARLATSGITVDARVITDASYGAGIVRGAQAVRTHDILSVRIELDSFVGWPGMAMVAQLKARRGPNGSAAGAFVQNYSNIDAPNFQAFGEVYAEQKLAGDKVRIKAGRLDFNSEFANTDNGGAFLNAAMGYSPTILAAPTFPLPTTGVNLVIAPHAGIAVGTGLFNGMGGAPAPEGGSSRFYIAQVNGRWSVGAKALPGRLGFGAYHHSGMFPSVDGIDEASVANVSGTGGWYSTLDQTLWKSVVNDGDGGAAKSIAAFAQLGRSNWRVPGVHSHVGAGATFLGFVPLLPQSLIGVGGTDATWHNGRESIAELFYQVPVLSRVTLVADEQLVRRQNAAGQRDNGHVFTLRVLVEY